MPNPRQIKDRKTQQCVLFPWDNQEVSVKRRVEENSAASRIQTMPTKYDPQHSRQQYEHRKHQEK